MYTAAAMMVGLPHADFGEAAVAIVVRRPGGKDITETAILVLGARASSPLMMNQAGQDGRGPHYTRIFSNPKQIFLRGKFAQAA